MSVIREQVDPHTRIYHTKIKLTDKMVEVGLPGESPTLPEGVEAQTTVGNASGNRIPVNLEIVNPILQAIVDIPGVKVCVLSPMQAQVTKSPTYAFDSIEPPLLALLDSLEMNISSIDIDEVRVCKNCGQKNRIPSKYVTKVAKCGKCKSELPLQ